MLPHSAEAWALHSKLAKQIACKSTPHTLYPFCQGFPGAIGKWGGLEEPFMLNP